MRPTFLQPEGGEVAGGVECCHNHSMSQNFFLTRHYKSSHILISLNQAILSITKIWNLYCIQYSLQYIDVGLRQGCVNLIMMDHCLCQWFVSYTPLYIIIMWAPRLKQCTDNEKLRNCVCPPSMNFSQPSHK